MTEYSISTYGRCSIESAVFHNGDACREYHLMIHPCASGNFEEQYRAAKESLATYISDKASDAVPVFMRWFLSDSANQQVQVESDEVHCAVSIIEQPPLDGSRLVLWVWLAEDADVKNSGRDIWTAGFGGAEHMWTTRSFRTTGTSEEQIYDIFRAFSDELQAHGCTLKDNCIRIWLFVNNIDTNYKDVVTGRRRFFEQSGLTQETHYIASTGIAGRISEHAANAVMDTYTIKDISADRIQFIKGTSHLNPTHEYGVTFERGTAVDHPDRRHVFISGTASINNKGGIVHPGDIEGQTLRMIDNVEVLLKEAECSFDEVMHMIVYLRNIADYAMVSEILRTRFPHHPKTFVLAPVCRPGWLVEMECMAVKAR